MVNKKEFDFGNAKTKMSRSLAAIKLLLQALLLIYVWSLYGQLG